jgi:hypothetical protein
MINNWRTEYTEYTTDPEYSGGAGGESTEQLSTFREFSVRSVYSLLAQASVRIVLLQLQLITNRLIKRHSMIEP